jgi:glycosyltransferase involved in cell wall biosynthesis
MKIALVIAAYSETGVPLAQLRLASALAAKGHQTDFIVGRTPKGEVITVPNGVRLIQWRSKRAIDMIPRLMKYLLREKPDIVFSAEDNLNASVLASAILSRSKSKITCSSRISPENVYSNSRFSKGWLLKKYVGSVIQRADALTCVSKDMVPHYAKIFPKVEFHGVYNIFDEAVAREKTEEAISHPWLEDSQIPVCIAAGYVAPRKGFADLIKAVSVVLKKQPVRLMILGDGPQIEELKGLATSLGINESIEFTGHVSNPLKYFSRADVFILSSLLEGMPNVLIEAMMAGCTPVATDCPTGPREILESGRYGYIVPMQNPDALAAGIQSAISNPVAPGVLAEAIIPFRAETVIAEHFRLLGL